MRRQRLYDDLHRVGAVHDAAGHRAVYGGSLRGKNVLSMLTQVTGHLRAGLRAVGAVWLQPGVQRGQCGVRGSKRRC
ncbi:hypothetical protein J4732_11470 [Serratia marcescens]|uniref:Uncharacterized protein n=1 Tax=Serratia marcescens TaxID=615 RepID=A0A939SUM5_SERMA|nr:hypothetical protein [Serratia marcescens]